jgi:hypothetical protein
MVADGVHRLISGTYFGGALGPWAWLVARMGIDPLAPAMALVFIVFGLAWFAAAVALLLARARYAVAALAVLTLWYVPIGTVFSIVVLVAALRPKHAPKDPKFRRNA